MFRHPAASLPAQWRRRAAARCCVWVGAPPSASVVVVAVAVTTARAQSGSTSAAGGANGHKRPPPPIGMRMPTGKRTLSGGASSGGVSTTLPPGLPGASAAAAAAAGGAGGGGDAVGGARRPVTISIRPVAKIAPDQAAADQKAQDNASALRILGLTKDASGKPLPEEQRARTFVSIGKPQEIGGGGFMGKMKMQPLNPQWKEDTTAKDMARRPPGKDVNAVWHSTSRRPRPSGIKFTDAQADTIIDAWVDKQWYAGIWRRMPRFSPGTIKRNKRFFSVGAFICVVVIFTIVWYFYRLEMDLFSQMEPRDQRDFKKVIFGARQGEVRDAAERALDRVDPLRILPDKEKMQHVMAAWREAGYVDRDWELHARTRKSLFKEPDLHHIFYWTILTIGRYMIGGGYLWWGIEEEGLSEADHAETKLASGRGTTLGGAANSVASPGMQV